MAPCASGESLAALWAAARERDVGAVGRCAALAADPARLAKVAQADGKIPEMCAEATIAALCDAATREEGADTLSYAPAAAAALVGLRSQGLWPRGRAPAAIAQRMAVAAAAWICAYVEETAERLAECALEASRLLVRLCADTPREVTAAGVEWLDAATAGICAGDDEAKHRWADKTAESLTSAACAAAAAGVLSPSAPQAHKSGVLKRLASAEGRQDLLAGVTHWVQGGAVANAMRLWRVYVALLAKEVLTDGNLLNPWLKPINTVLARVAPAERTAGQRAWRELCRAWFRAGVGAKFSHIKLACAPLAKHMSDIEGDEIVVAAEALSTWKEVVRSLPPADLLLSKRESRDVWSAFVDKTLRLTVNNKSLPKRYGSATAAAVMRGLECLLCLLERMQDELTARAALSVDVYVVETEPDTLAGGAEGASFESDRNASGAAAGLANESADTAGEREWHVHLLTRVEQLARVLGQARAHCAAAKASSLPRRTVELLQARSAACFRALAECTGAAILGADGELADAKLLALRVLLQTCAHGADEGLYLPTELLTALAPALARGAVHLTADAKASGAEARSSLAERLMKLWSVEARRNPADREADEHAQACVAAFTAVRVPYADGVTREHLLSALCAGLAEATRVEVVTTAWTALAGRIAHELDDSASGLAAFGNSQGGSHTARDDKGVITAGELRSVFPGLVDLLVWPFEQAVLRRQPAVLSGDAGKTLLASWHEVATAAVRATAVVSSPLDITARAELCKRIHRVAEEALLASEDIDVELSDQATEAWAPGGTIAVLTDAVAHLAGTQDLDDAPIAQAPAPQVLGASHRRSPRKGGAATTRAATADVSHSSRVLLARTAASLLAAAAGVVAANADSQGGKGGKDMGRCEAGAALRLLVSTKHLVRGCHAEGALASVLVHAVKGLAPLLAVSTSLKPNHLSMLRDAVVACFEAASLRHESVRCQELAQTLAPLLRAHESRPAASEAVASEAVAAYCKHVMAHAPSSLPPELRALVAEPPSQSPARARTLRGPFALGSPSPWMTNDKATPSPYEEDEDERQVPLPRRLAFQGQQQQRTGFLDVDTDADATATLTQDTDIAPDAHACPHAPGTHAQCPADGSAVAASPAPSGTAAAEPAPSEPAAGGGDGETRPGGLYGGSSGAYGLSASAQAVSSGDVFATQTPQGTQATPSQATPQMPQGPALQAPPGASEPSAARADERGEGADTEHGGGAPVAMEATLAPDVTAAASAAALEPTLAPMNVDLGNDPGNASLSPSAGPAARVAPSMGGDVDLAPFAAAGEATDTEDAQTPAMFGRAYGPADGTPSASPIDAEAANPQDHASAAAPPGPAMGGEAAEHAAAAAPTAETVAEADEEGDARAVTPPAAQDKAVTKRVSAPRGGKRRGAHMLKAAMATAAAGGGGSGGARPKHCPAKRARTAPAAQALLPGGDSPATASQQAPTAPGAEVALDAALEALEAAASNALSPDGAGLGSTALLERLPRLSRVLHLMQEGALRAAAATAAAPL